MLGHRDIPSRNEELVADFETQARALISFCGLDWDARCLAFHRE